MPRVRKAAQSVAVVALISGVIGYIFGSVRSLPQPEAHAAESIDLTQTASVLATVALQQTRQSDTAPARRKTYYPNTEVLGSNEMRVISLGTGMPNQRKAQASACWLVELGNGDKFLFDLGTGSVANLSVLEIPYDLVNKVFVGHLHSDHVGDFAAWHIGGWVGGRQKAPRIWGPDASKDRPEWGTNYFLEHQM